MVIPREVNKLIKKGELNGSIPAMMTFLRRSSDGYIFRDGEKEGRLIKELAPYSDAILVAGTTGQGPSFSTAEKSHIAARVIRETGLPVIIGISENDFKKAKDEIKELEHEIPNTTFLVATGFYNKPGQEGVREFFLGLADAIDGNIIVYNIPSRTDGTNISAEVSLELSRHPKIIGEKEASGDFQQIDRKIQVVDKKGYAIMAGDDTIVARLMHYGGRGVISATANYAPGISKRLVEAGLRGKPEEAERLQYEYFTPASSAVFAGRNPITLAYMFGSQVALPLSLEDLTEQQRSTIDEVVRKFKGESGFVDLDKYRGEFGVPNIGTTL